MFQAVSAANSIRLFPPEPEELFPRSPGSGGRTRLWCSGPPDESFVSIPLNKRPGPKGVRRNPHRNHV